MIIEFICYKCKCSKCGYDWVTKDHDLPKTCARCKSVRWNDDQEVAPVVELRPVEMRVKVTELRRSEPSVFPDLDELPAGPTWRFTKDGPQYADDGNVYRKQYMVENPKRVRSVEVEELDHERVVRVL